MRRVATVFSFAALVTASCGGRLLDGGTGTNGAGSGGDASTTSSGGSSTSGGPDANGGPIVDAAPPKRDASTSPDASLVGPGVVSCNYGKETCDGKLGQVCCVLVEPGRVVGASCVTGRCGSSDGSPPISEIFACDGPEDCEGQKSCCAYRGGGSGCETSESCNLNTDHVQLCHKDSDCDVLPGTLCCPAPGDVVPAGTCRPSCN